MVEPDRMERCWFDGARESIHAQGLFDDGFEITILSNVLHAVVPDLVHGVQSLTVRAAWFHDAIGRHDDGPREAGEFELLVLPCRSKVADQMRELLLQLGIPVRWQHLAVRVHVDAQALRLLQQGMQVLHVMPRNENALALDSSHADLRRFRSTEFRGMGLVQQGQDTAVDFTNLHNQCKCCIHFGIIGWSIIGSAAFQRAQLGQHSLHVGRDALKGWQVGRLVFWRHGLQQGMTMRGIRACTLDAVHCQFRERESVFMVRLLLSGRNRYEMTKRLEVI
mmetsp:Transcript_16822/g.47166  ORF Transcript_16822/g.47166 Transcript_16822/m.47166 type:complete len:279 (-) Transcript_16822:745-1581(-)